MRKLGFMLAFMLTCSFGFAGNSVETNKKEKSVNVKVLKNTNFKFNTYKSDIGTCYATYDAYNEEGEYVGSVTLHWPSMNEDTCRQEAAAVLRFLNS